jgi:hypothetical protein
MSPSFSRANLPLIYDEEGTGTQNVHSQQFRAAPSLFLARPTVRVGIGSARMEFGVSRLRFMFYETESNSPLLLESTIPELGLKTLRRSGIRTVEPIRQQTSFEIALKFEATTPRWQKLPQQS